MSNEWQHNDAWEKYGESFCIVISRRGCIDIDGNIKNKWCIYAYVYKNNFMFSGIDKLKSISQDCFFDMPLHGGCTYFKEHVNLIGEVDSYQIGCDYNHLYDDNYLEMKNKEDAYIIFRDADKLFNYLLNYGDKK